MVSKPGPHSFWKACANSTDRLSTEFRTFVEAAERQLLLLFQSIDRNHDGKVGREELHAAFQKAGLAVPRRRLAGFFDEMDMNHDGYISFDEWRYALPCYVSYCSTRHILSYTLCLLTQAGLPPPSNLHIQEQHSIRCILVSLQC